MKPYTIADAETELRAAVDADDTEKIRRLEPVIDRLEAADRRPDATLHAAALWYAQHGLHVFPLAPSSKIPFPRTHGCKDATTDVEQINDWWTRHPDANIGIATGYLVDVVDIDGYAGHCSRTAHWDEIFADIDSDNVGKVLTPRAGGMHIYVPATGDGNATGIVPSVDYRGLGGYVVAPPSRTDQGVYRWLGEPRVHTLATGTAA